MPKHGKSDADWKRRLREYAYGKFKFGQGQRPPKSSRWAGEIVLIEKCPFLGPKKLFGGTQVCCCGYHGSSTQPVLSNVERVKTVATNEPVPELLDCDVQLKVPLAQSSSHIGQQVKPASKLLKVSPTEECTTIAMPVSEGLISVELSSTDQFEKIPSKQTMPISLPAAFEKSRKNDYSLRLPEGWKTTMELNDQQWVGKDLFSSKGVLVVQLKTWWHPPQLPSPNSKSRPEVESYFQNRLFLWMPRRMWSFDFKCPVCKPLTSLTSKGLYNRVRSVIDLTNKYYLAAEYLECRNCKGTFISYDSRLLEELPVDLRYRFPVVLTRKFACDKSVVTLMRGRTFGNTPTGVCNEVKEIHSEEWIRNAIAYLSDCKRQKSSRERLGLEVVSYPNLPNYKSPPSPKWFLAVYVRDVWSRLELLKASATSVYGTILKIDSTKKITRKLQGTAAKTVSWCTNIGNEKGEVLISILTTSESLSNLKTLAEGLMDRYEKASQSAPLIIYTDRDCCKDDGPSKFQRLFYKWSSLIVRMDSWHFMRRLSKMCTNESHPLYGHFMAKVSFSIFEWDVDDVKLLFKAKKCELQIAGISNPSNETVRKATNKNELAKHCRRKTRGTSATIAFLDELITSLTGVTDSLGVPLFRDDALEVWEVEKRHVSCIQDPENIPLYTRTGDLSKGNIQLPVYRCARGTTSLESFHLHLNNFIPGTAANDMHFQAFLLDGLYRWNAARASAAIEAQSKFRTFDLRLQEKLFSFSKDILGSPIDPLYHPPSIFTGELFGIEYLYFESGKTIQELLSLDEMDARIEEGMENYEEDDILPGGNFRVDTEADIDQDFSLDEFVIPEDSSDTEVATDCNSIPGWDRVDKLASVLVSCNSGLSLKQSDADQIVCLYNDLMEYDKRPLKFDRTVKPSKGRFARSKEESSGSHVNVEAMKRCFLSGGSPSHSPAKSRLVEAICSRLCIQIPSGEKNPYVSRFAKIIQHYNIIRERVMNNDAILAGTGMALFQINETTLTNWFKKKTRAGEISLLLQGVSSPSTSFCSAIELPPAMQQCSTQLPLNQFIFTDAHDATGLANLRHHNDVPNNLIVVNENMITDGNLGEPIILLDFEGVNKQPVVGGELNVTPTSRTTDWRKRKSKAVKDPVKASVDEKRSRKAYCCSKCKQPMTGNGHSQYKGSRYCPNFDNMTKEAWLASKKM